MWLNDKITKIFLNQTNFTDLRMLNIKLQTGITSAGFRVAPAWVTFFYFTVKKLECELWLKTWRRAYCYSNVSGITCMVGRNVESEQNLPRTASNIVMCPSEHQSGFIWILNSNMMPLKSTLCSITLYFSSVFIVIVYGNK